MIIHNIACKKSCYIDNVWACYAKLCIVLFFCNIDCITAALKQFCVQTPAHFLFSKIKVLEAILTKDHSMGAFRLIVFKSDSFTTYCFVLFISDNEKSIEFTKFAVAWKHGVD